MMETRIIQSNKPGALDEARKVLISGGLAAFPTDTVYGLAARITDPAGINRLYEVKGRNTLKAIAVLIGNLDQLPLVALEFPLSARKLADKFWPGALTLIIPRRMDLPPKLSQYPTVGIRMPDLAFALLLLEHTGPLATTSANLSGGSNPVNANDVVSQLGGAIDLIIDGGSTPGPVASTVVDCSISSPKILRQGVISAGDIANTLGLSLSDVE